MSTPVTVAPSFAAGRAVVPSPQPRSSTFMLGVMPSVLTSSSPLCRIVSAMRVKSPFSQRALFGLILSMTRSDIFTPLIELAPRPKTRRRIVRQPTLSVPFNLIGRLMLK